MDSKLIEYFLQRGYILSISQLQNKIIGSCVLKQQGTFLDFVEVINSKDLIECFSGLVEVLEQYSYSYQTNYLPLSGLYQTSVMHQYYQGPYGEEVVHEEICRVYGITLIDSFEKLEHALGKQKKVEKRILW